MSKRIIIQYSIHEIKNSYARSTSAASGVRNFCHLSASKFLYNRGVFFSANSMYGFFDTREIIELEKYLLQNYLPNKRGIFFHVRFFWH